MILAIDFDGVLVENTWPNEPRDMPGAVEALRELLAAKHTVIIWTCRAEDERWGTCSGKRFIREWCKKHGLGELLLNRNCLVTIQEMFQGSETRKIYADVYIDDKNLGGFPGWERALQILGIKPSDPPRVVRNDAGHISNILEWPAGEL